MSINGYIYTALGVIIALLIVMASIQYGVIASVKKENFKLSQQNEALAAANAGLQRDTELCNEELYNSHVIIKELEELRGHDRVVIDTECERDKALLKQEIHRLKEALLQCSQDLGVHNEDCSEIIHNRILPFYYDGVRP